MYENEMNLYLKPEINICQKKISLFALFIFLTLLTDFFFSLFIFWFNNYIYF